MVGLREALYASAGAGVSCSWVVDIVPGTAPGAGGRERTARNKGRKRLYRNQPFRCHTRFVAALLPHRPIIIICERRYLACRAPHPASTPPSGGARRLLPPPRSLFLWTIMHPARPIPSLLETFSLAAHGISSRQHARKTPDALVGPRLTLCRWITGTADRTCYSRPAYSITGPDRTYQMKAYLQPQGRQLARPLHGPTGKQVTLRMVGNVGDKDTRTQTD